MRKSKEDTTAELTAHFKDSDLFEFRSLENVNFDPHPYMIGPKHIAYANAHHSASLDEKTCEKVGCAHPGCQVPYSEHKSDLVAFLQLKRNATPDEAQVQLKAMTDALGEDAFDGISFVETPEKFRIE